jgi:hypothetical protein
MAHSEQAPLEVHVDAAGVVRFVWDDTFSELLNHGAVAVERASTINWTPAGWISRVDAMGKVGPETLGPFGLYEQALAAERAWIQAHGLSV